ncbi:MAG TPA: MCE family protein [Bacteroides sp.]|nr:MCE family protein [Bacteroides sp.]
MKLRTEAKIGMIGVATLAVLIWGMNYLKGKNVLSKGYTVYALCQHAGGMREDAPVMMNGVKIGYVDKIELHPGDRLPVTLILHIEKKYVPPAESVAEMYSADLLGTKAIRIRTSGSMNGTAAGDTLQTAVVPDLLSGLEEGIAPVLEDIGALARTLDSLGETLEGVIGSETTKQTISHLSSISSSLSASLEAGGALELTFSNLKDFSSMLKSREEEVGSLLGHLNSISESADSAGIRELTGNLTSAAIQLDRLLDQINSGTGNAGRMVYSDTLMRNLESLISDLDLLVRDLRDHPEDYVQVSLFGRSKKGRD